MTISFSSLCAEYLGWLEIHQAPKTVHFYNNFIKQYLAYLGDKASEPASTMKPHQVNKWVDSHTKWSDNYKRGAVIALNRVYNWGIKQGHLDNNPIKTADRAPMSSRKTYATPADMKAILAHIDSEDPFYDFVYFLWHAFARPQEVRHIEARHVDLDAGLITFPIKESKGKLRARCLVLLPNTKPIIERLVAKYPEGKLFRNADGNALSCSVVCQRMQVLSRKIGKKVISYDLRHGIVTHALKNSKSVTDIAAMTGHVDGSMISKVYSHVHEDKKRLQEVFGSTN